jgi:hypothetical protein
MWLAWLEPSGKHASQLGIITPAVGIRHLQFLRRPTAANVCFSSPHQSAGLLSSVLHSALLFLVLALLTLILFLLLANVPLSDLPLSNLPLSTHLYQLISPRLSLPTSLYQTYLCQTCLSQTQLIPIKLISTNSSISNLSVPNLLSIPSLSLDWPSEILLALTLGHGGSRSSLVGQAQRFVPRLVCSCRFVLGRFGPRPPL